MNEHIQKIVDMKFLSEFTTEEKVLFLIGAIGWGGVSGMITWFALELLEKLG